MLFRSFPCTEVISSMPFTKLVKGMDPAPPPEVLQAADEISYRDFLSVALVVPEGSVFQIQNRAYVYRVEDHVAHQTQIEVGARRFGVVEVIGGLKEGDAIVFEGIVKLRDGVTVRYEGGEKIGRASCRERVLCVV